MPIDPPPDTPPPSRAAVVGKQVGVVLLGLVLAGVMVALGLWQLGVYNAQGHQQAEARASAPAVPLSSVARPGQEVGDAYGRQVSFAGTYDPRLQVLVPNGADGRSRVLTALRLPDGGILPVVRGQVSGTHAPTPPSGKVTETGLLMPSEGADTSARPGAQPTTVVLSSLVQRWDGAPLINGFVTLTPAESRAQSLTPVLVDLPSSHGRLRNGFYALQWWVFAAFAVWMGIRMARDFGRSPGGEMGSDPTDDLSGDTDALRADSPGNGSTT